MKRSVDQICLAVILFCFAAINIRWVWLFRRGQLLDIDEAGYLLISFNYYYSLIRGGLIGWIRSIEGPSVHAPLTTALSSLLYCLLGPHLMIGFMVPLLAGVVTVAATYVLGRSVGSGRIGLISGLLVASCPIIISYSRSYHFAMPATAVATLALVALLMSDRFNNFGWASIFGFCLGLLPLARTMTIAFIPGLALGAAVYAVASSGDRRRRILVLIWSLMFAVATAATWLWATGKYVFEYLVSYGYGARAVEYGPQRSPFSLSKLLLIIQIFDSYIFLPHLLVLLAGAVALTYVGVRCFARRGLATAARTIVGSSELPILLFVVGAVGALASSRNVGSAFIAPIVPAAVVLSVWSLYQVKTGKVYGLSLAAVACVVSVIATLPLIYLKLSFARPHFVQVPMFGQATLSDGRGTIQRYEASGGFGINNAVEPIDRDLDRAWVGLNADTAIRIKQSANINPVVAFGFRNFLYNVNTVGLQYIQRTGVLLSFRMVEPVMTGETVSGYREWMTRGGAADACLLLLSDGHEGEIQPPVNLQNMKEAAQQAGFALADQWSMPNGQGVALWERTTETPNCSISK
jgi:4-amino-4-deoxy-L-arabinose transferase-like glycosyltransferase